MNTSKLAPLSVFGLIGRSVQIYFSNPLKFLWYALLSVVLNRATDLPGSLGMQALFINILSLHEGWMVCAVAYFYVKNDGQAGAQSRITSGSPTRKALACLRALYFLRSLAAGRSIWMRMAIEPVLSFLMEFWPSVIVIERKPIHAAAKRSASITSQTFWALFKLYLAFFICCGCTLAAVAIISMGALGLDQAEFEQHLTEYPEPIVGVLVDFLLMPIFTIAVVALYLQHRCEKEGLTIDMLTQELTGAAQTTESTGFIHVLNKQTHSNVPSLEAFHND